MVKHVKIYFQYFDYKTQSDAICEACQGQAVDVHHIHGRGKDRDVIGNLIALCRRCHERAHFSKNHVKPDEFQLIHNYFLAGSRKIMLK